MEMFTKLIRRKVDCYDEDHDLSFVAVAHCPSAREPRSAFLLNLLWLMISE